MRIKTEVNFETAHRQLGDASKCGRLHGHNWMAVFVIEGKVPKGKVGYLIDFKDLKAVCQHYDHTVLLHKDDPLVSILKAAGQQVVTLGDNPTAEFLAETIAMDVKIMLEEMDIEWDKIDITVWENNKSGANSELVRLPACE
jgi:6-pyruvoyltetrahydropterin/6-carboxytetrahydropterin synthase